MRHLDAFLALLCGRFDNARQLEELKQLIRQVEAGTEGRPQTGGTTDRSL